MPLLTTQSAKGYGWSATSSAGTVVTYHQIATTLNPSGSSYTFSSIPSTYDHLELRIFGKDGRTPVYSSCNIQINGDTGNNYFLLAPQVDTRAGSPYGGESVSVNFGGFVNWAGSSSSNYYGSGTVKLLDYSNNSRNKTLMFNGGYVGFGDGTSEQGIVTQGMGQWRNTNAITSLILTTSGGSSFASGTRFSLYGIKGAA
jgi:hypothetical protein